VKFNQLKNNFTSGELSEPLTGRVELEEYKNGVALLQNFYPLKEGGVKYRAGFRWFHKQDVASTFEDSDPLILDFHSANFSYAVVVQPGTQNMQIYRANDGVVCSIADTVYWTKDQFLVDAAGVQTFTGFQRYQVQYAQSGDIMVILDGTGRCAPMVIRRTSDTGFAVVPFFSESYFDSARPATPTELRMAFADPNTTATTLTPSVTTGVGTITASSAIFTGDWVGRLIKITHAGVTGMALVTAKTTDSILVISTYVNFGATTSSTNWEVSAWGGDAGFPRSLCFFEGRLIFGGSPLYPDTVWCSEVGDIFHFMQRRLAQDATTDVSGLNYFGPVLGSTDAFNFIPASREANNICWVVGGRELQIGTDKTEYIGTGGTEQNFSLASFFLKDISNHGSYPTQPRRVAGDTIFVGQDGKTLRALTPQSAEQANCPELSILASQLIEESVPNANAYDHLNDVNIAWLVWNDTYSSLFCIVRNYGSGQNRLFSLGYEKTSKTVAFWRTEVDGYVSGICSLPDHYDPDPTDVFVSGNVAVRSRALWMVINRAPGVTSSEFGTTIERMNAPYNTIQNSQHCAFLDCQKSFFHINGILQGPVIATGWPEGTVMDVVANGNLLSLQYTADASGNITLPSTYTTVNIGFRYQGKIKTLPLEAGQTFGQAQGSPRRPHEVVFRTFRSRGGEYYFDAVRENKFPIVKSTEASSTTLNSAELVRKANASSWDTQLTIEQNEPYPMTIMWATIKGVTQDG